MCQKEWQCVYGCAENRDRLVAAAAAGVDRNCLNPDTNYAGSIARTLSPACSDTQLQSVYSDGLFSAEQCQIRKSSEAQACLMRTPYSHTIIVLYATWLFTFTFMAVVSAAQHTLLSHATKLPGLSAAPPPYSYDTNDLEKDGHVPLIKAGASFSSGLTL